MEHEQLPGPVLAAADVARSLGASVKSLRNARGWTQLDLAQRLRQMKVDLHQTTVAKLESGNRPTPADEIYALAVVLGVSYDSLLPSLIPKGAGPAELQEAKRAMEVAQTEDRLAQLRVQEVQALAEEAQKRADEAKERAKVAQLDYLKLVKRVGTADG